LGKWHGYVPQQRSPRLVSTSEPFPAEAVISTPEASFEDPMYGELFGIMEVGKDGKIAEEPHGIPAIHLKRHLDFIVPDGETPNRDDYKLAALLAAKNMIGGVTYLNTLRIDVLRNLKSITTASKPAKQAMLYRVHTDWQEAAQGLSYIEQLPYSGAGSIITALLTPKIPSLAMRVHYAAEGKSYVDQLMQHIASNDEIGLSGEEGQNYIRHKLEQMIAFRALVARRSGENPSAYRPKLLNQLNKLTRSEMVTFVETELARYDTDWLSWSEQDIEEENNEMLPTIEGGQELDFSILPEGTDIREYTENLCNSLTEQDRESVELRRVAVLEKLREVFGASTSFYIHGRPRGNVQTDNGEAINEAYIGLVLQYHDPKGNVKAEDAIVVSPIKKRHAGYIVRHDEPLGNLQGWRKILALPKKSAREHGARPLKFTQVTGRDMYEAYVAKAVELLTCPIGEFGSDYELRMNGDGSYRMRPRKLGRLAEMAMNEMVGF
jgi:hypothetical protein